MMTTMSKSLALKITFSLSACWNNENISN